MILNPNIQFLFLADPFKSDPFAADPFANESFGSSAAKPVKSGDMFENAFSVGW